jgi:hypothetical protein
MEPRWHRIVRSAYTAAFVLVWLEAVSCFGYFLLLARGASPVATPELTAGIVNHGRAFYVAVWQKQLYDLLLTTMAIGIPSIMVAGFVLHHVVGVRIFAAKGRR